MIQHFKKLPIKKQLSYSLGALMVGLTILKYIFSFTLVLIITDNINSYAKDYVSKQIQRHSEVLLTQSSDLFVNYLQSSSSGFLLPVVYGTENVYRNDFIFINDRTTNYYDWSDSTLSQPLVYSDRLNRLVSLKNSAYYVPGVYADTTGLSAEVKDTVEATNYLDYIWTSLYTKYHEFTTVYIGMNEGGVFRQYPGKTSSQVDRTYDPRQRGWYQQAMNRLDDVVVSSPYADARGLGNMITFSKTIFDENHQPVGVAAADLLISTLVESIQKITLYKTGNVILIQQDKTVIVNKDGDTSFFNIIDLNIGYNQVSTASDGQFIYTYKKIQEFGGKYILIVKVNSSEIEAPLETVKENMSSTKTKLILILLLIFACVLIFAIILTFCVVRMIARPIEEIMRISDDIINDIGRKEQDKSSKPLVSKAKIGIAEFNEVRNGIDQLKIVIDKKKQEDKKKLICENRYYGLPDADIPWNFELNSDQANRLAKA